MVANNNGRLDSRPSKKNSNAQPVGVQRKETVKALARLSEDDIDMDQIDEESFSSDEESGGADDEGDITESPEKNKAKKP